MAVDAVARAIAAGKVPVDAYEMAVAGGYTGTKEQFEEDMGNSGTNAANAANSAAAAAASATTAANAAGNLAPAYSASATYAVGDHVLYDGGYYVCNTAITTAEAWTAAHWTAVKVGPEITDLKTQTDKLIDLPTENLLDIADFTVAGGVTTVLDTENNAITVTTSSANVYRNVQTEDTFVPFNLVVGKSYRLHAKAEKMGGNPEIVVGIRGIEDNAAALAKSFRLTDGESGFIDFTVDQYMQRVTLFVTFATSNSASVKFSELWIKEYDTSGKDIKAREEIDDLKRGLAIDSVLSLGGEGVHTVSWLTVNKRGNKITFDGTKGSTTNYLRMTGNFNGTTSADAAKAWERDLTITKGVYKFTVEKIGGNSTISDTGSTFYLYIEGRETAVDSFFFNKPLIYPFEANTNIMIIYALHNSGTFSDYTLKINIEKLNLNSTYDGKKCSILGDSISTYDGYIPEGNATYYPRDTISAVRFTWWYELICGLNMVLDTNNSWSGSYVTTANGEQSAGCMTRCEDLGSPDVIIVWMGINDFINEVPLGTYDGTASIPATTTSFREAYAIMLNKILTKYQRAEVWVCTLPQCERDLPSGFPEINGNGVPLENFNKAIRELADAFGVKVLEHAKSGLTYQNMTVFDPNELHPNIYGHMLIANNDIRQMDGFVRTRYWRS